MSDYDSSSFSYGNEYKILKQVSHNYQEEEIIRIGYMHVERNINLVYGGGSIGLMGLISQIVLDGRHHVLGVIPTTLMPRKLLFFFAKRPILTWAQLGMLIMGKPH
ncbi:hypothetical protein AAZX31_14G098700 [Glycine max]